MPPSDLMFNRKIKFTIPHIDNKLNIDNISKDFQKIFHHPNFTRKNIMTSDSMQRIPPHMLEMES